MIDVFDLVSTFIVPNAPIFVLAFCSFSISDQNCVLVTGHRIFKDFDDTIGHIIVLCVTTKMSIMLVTTAFRARRFKWFGKFCHSDQPVGEGVESNSGLTRIQLFGSIILGNTDLF